MQPSPVLTSLGLKRLQCNLQQTEKSDQLYNGVSVPERTSYSARGFSILQIILRVLPAHLRRVVQLNGAVLRATVDMCIAAAMKQTWNFMSDAMLGMTIDQHPTFRVKKGAVAVAKRLICCQNLTFLPNLHSTAQLPRLMGDGSKNERVPLWRSGC